MTGPGAEEEIEQYGEHYCPKCNQAKSPYKNLCDECEKETENEE